MFPLSLAHGAGLAKDWCIKIGLSLFVFQKVTFLYFEKLTCLHLLIIVSGKACDYAAFHHVDKRYPAICTKCSRRNIQVKKKLLSSAPTGF